MVAPEVTLDIRGMRCDNCARSLTAVLADLEGVAEARVSYALEEAQVSFDPTRTSLDMIVDAVDSAGYEAVRRSDQNELAESEERSAVRRRDRKSVV